MCVRTPAQVKVSAHATTCSLFCPYAFARTNAARLTVPPVSRTCPVDAVLSCLLAGQLWRAEYIVLLAPELIVVVLDSMSLIHLLGAKLWDEGY